jgi:hypothetical protein
MADFVTRQDRWRPELPPYPINEPVLGISPYHQNLIKGDLPIFGQRVFLALTGLSNTQGELRGVTLVQPGSYSVEPSLVETLLLSGEFFQGEGAFAPREWELKVTGAVKHLRVESEGRDVDETDPRLQELFATLRIGVVSKQFDFVSARAGVQPLNTDFKGLIFLDANAGARLFGTADGNRIQWNVAFFDLLEKDADSALNTPRRRDQQVWVANLFLQDYFSPGYTALWSFHASEDDRVRAHYIGWAGDGCVGPINVSHAFYYALGTDEANPIAGRAVDIDAQMFALELSHDIDWRRIRVSFAWASGDSDPGDSRATGFDSIFDSPNFAGGAFGFWNRQAIERGARVVANKNSFLPDLRGKAAASMNFVNPGILVFNAGFDAEIAPTLKAILNANHLRFVHTDALEAALALSRVHEEIGDELSIGLQWRPALNNNVLVTLGASGLFPDRGLEEILGRSTTLYHVFLELNLVY